MIKRQYLIACDRCLQDDGLTFDTPAEAAEYEKDQGWIFVDDAAICPDCAEKLFHQYRDALEQMNKAGEND